MLTRLSPLVPSVRAIALFFLLWTVLAHASTAAFALLIAGSLSQWLDAHAWVGFLVGFTLLALTVVSPDLKPRLPEWIKLPQTAHEEITELRESFLEVVRVQNQLHKGESEVRDVLAKRIATLEDDRTQAIRDHSALEALEHLSTDWGLSR